MLSALWNFVFFIIAIGILVTIHEAGHFFAARRCGVKVYRFSLGFGPVIWRHKGKDGVEYALSLIPLGGYVKMKGEPGDTGLDNSNGNGMRVSNKKRKGLWGNLSDDKEERDLKSSTDGIENRESSFGTHSESESKQGSSNKVIETDFAELRVGDASDYDDAKSQHDLTAESDSFAEKSLCQRAFIVAAGPLSNMVLGYLIFVIVNIMGVDTFKPIVADTIPNTPAYEAGFKANDLIIKADGSEVKDWPDFSNQVLINLGDKVSVVVKGDRGEGEVRNLSLDLKNVNILPKTDLMRLLGIYPMFGKVSDGFTDIAPNSPAAKAGIKEGDKVLAINGEPVTTWYSLLNLTKKYENSAPIDFEIRSSSGEIYHTQLTPEQLVIDGKPTGRVMYGFVATTEFDPSLIYTKQYTIFEAFGEAWNDTVNVSLLIVNSIKKLISGVISAQNINGPISIAQGAGQSAEFGLVSFLMFLALLSINLGIVNLIPLPVLDGGQLMYIAYEAVAKRPPNEKIQNALSLLGLALLLFLTFFSIFNDLTNL